MLVALHIRDMLIIDRLELAFQPGLNVLTGETGAGKSILLDSLGFVLGWRGRADLVRSGADTGEVTAEFHLTPDHPAHAVLEEAGWEIEDDALILRRINTRDGRKTAYVNDRRCSGEMLRALSETLIELQGQHDDRGLLNPRGHRAILDDFGKCGPLLADTRAAWAARRSALQDLEAAQQRLADLRAEEEFLRHAVAELTDLTPLPGEDAELDSARRRMQGAEKIRDDIQRAWQILGPDGAEGTLGEGMRWLEGAAEAADGHLDEPLAALSRALVELGEAQQGVAHCLDLLDFDPLELERTEERLFAIRALARKHSVAPDDLAALARDLTARLADLDHSEGAVGDLQAAVTRTEAAYQSAAQALCAGRTAAATALDAAVAAELEPLKMGRAVFTTQLTPADPGPEGTEAVAFQVATNPGAPAGPMNKIASGGELSRFLLALKVCLSGTTPGLTMIFDEIDRGVGGPTANAVGRRLVDLAAGGQVLVVTHSPQVAALGAHHWRVQKQVADGQTTSTVVPLAPDDRVDEIARMLSGDTITPEARAAALALLRG